MPEIAYVLNATDTLKYASLENKVKLTTIQNENPYARLHR